MILRQNLIVKRYMFRRYVQGLIQAYFMRSVFYRWNFGASCMESLGSNFLYENVSKLSGDLKNLFQPLYFAHVVPVLFYGLWNW